MARAVGPFLFLLWGLRLPAPAFGVYGNPYQFITPAPKNVAACIGQASLVFVINLKALYITTIIKGNPAFAGFVAGHVVGLANQFPNLAKSLSGLQLGKFAVLRRRR